ncbi:MAG: histidinol dehydrogenase [Gammaproteobacteria bacterium]|nr:MAG: histidinol dehydrogenase [Gammaproteobacteria bacterium]
MTLKITRLDTAADDFWPALKKAQYRDQSHVRDVSDTVRGIIDDVRARGDAAVVEYTNRFDRLNAASMADLEMPAARLAEAVECITPEQRDALERAAERVRLYHQRQLSQSWDYTEQSGNRLGQKVTPLQRAGLYVPGGKAAYPSSVIMTAVPAKVAGVDELMMVVPTPDGEVNELVLAAAHFAGVDRVFTIGGAQAVAALAYGTETVPGVDKIVGPGNQYVAEAKRQVFGQVGIDMIAGPSEIAIIADSSANPDWVAMDLFSQAEHDEEAQSILVSPDADVIDAVQAAMERLIDDMPRKAIIRQSLENNGILVRTADLDQAVAVIDRIAPEHLELAVSEPVALERQVRNAGAIFVGHWSAEALGDYCAGPNHVLPTSGTARFSSPLGVYDFQKRSSIIHCSPQGASELGRISKTLADAESLSAHAQSAAYRVADGE